MTTIRQQLEAIMREPIRYRAAGERVYHCGSNYTVTPSSLHHVDGHASVADNPHMGRIKRSPGSIVSIDVARWLSTVPNDGADRFHFTPATPAQVAAVLDRNSRYARTDEPTARGVLALHIEQRRKLARKLSAPGTI